jgi:hypothetical protein
VPSVRRQLRELEERREEGLRDLGSMALEMHRRQDFELDLLRAQARELAAIESQIRELDPDRGDTQA